MYSIIPLSLRNLNPNKEPKCPLLPTIFNSKILISALFPEKLYLNVGLSALINE
jgi:hypothetical protein